MLVLTRKKNETIVIPTLDGEITITVTNVGSGKVQLGIDAPREIPVLRGELPRLHQPAPDPGVAA